MMKTRREFIVSLPVLSASLLLSSVSAKVFPSDPRSSKQIGIQLWTLKDQVNIDLHSTLEAVSQFGFSGIEAYGFDGSSFGFSPVEFRSICSNLGLDIYSSHSDITSDNAHQYAEKAAEAGLQYLILPSMMGRPKNTADDYRSLADEMNIIGSICAAYNIHFGYHNHAFEFELIDSIIPYHLLLMETDPELVSFQMDLYWVVKAGHNPLAYFKQYPGRFSSLHIKDMGQDGDSCIIGNGMIDFNSILKSTDINSPGFLIYEQEHYSEGTPLHCAEQSARYMLDHFFQQ